jgi:hypothetical protein
MQTPLEIAFHGLPSSQELEADIRRRAEKLDQLYPRITSCRVSIEALHNPASAQSQASHRWQVHIDLHVPGGKLVTSREPHRPQRKYAEPDLHTVLRDSFKAAERQLKQYKQLQRGEVKQHGQPANDQISERSTDVGDDDLMRIAAE